MSTNFYIVSLLYPTSLSEPGPATEVEHIGLSSGGWAFGFQGQKQKTVEQWRVRLSTLSPHEVINDEYGTTIKPAEFWARVNSSRDMKTGRGRGADLNWIDEGFLFSNYEFC